MTDETQPTPGAPETEPLDPAPYTPQDPPEPAEPAPKRQPRFDRRMILLGVLSGIVGVAILLLALMVFAPSIAPLKVGAVRDAATAREEDDVEDVAVRFAEALYSFNYRTIDADLDRIRDFSTGNFSRELEQVLGEVDVFKKAIVDARGESTGAVEGVDVRKIEDSTATARAFVVQTIRNKKNPEARQQFSAVELTLVKTSGGWKVDDVQQLSGAAPTAEEGQ